MTRNNKQQRGARPARKEPALGDLDLLDRSADEAPARRRAAKSPSRPRARRWPWVLLALLVVLAGAAWVERATIRSWLPQTQFNQLLSRADAALQAGRLDGHQGDSARELYAAARTLRPEDARARDGLHAVGEAELKQAKKQLDAGQMEQAASSLKTARALLGGGDELDRLDQRLATIKARSDKLETLIERAGQALADGNLVGKRGAASLYKQALLADPGNAIARHGLDKVGKAMARQIGQALTAGQLNQADKQIDRLSTLLPDFSDLPRLHADLSQARADAKVAQQKLLQQAQADLAAGRFTGSGSNNALARYRKVLEADPDNAVAQRGVRQVASGLLARANARMQDGHLTEAGQLLDEVAGLVGKDVPQLASARQRLAELARQPQAPAPLSREQKAKVQRLITRAQAAADSGHLMLPPGNSAHALYPLGLSIDADNSDPQVGVASPPPLTPALFTQAPATLATSRAAQLLSACS